MKTFVTLPRTISVAGYTATINIKFKSYSLNWHSSQYYCSVSETAKAIKAIAKSAGFNVLRCKSESYSGGDSVDITVATELTSEQVKRNEEIKSTCQWGSHIIYPDWAPEPREDLLAQIAWAFEAWKFNGMEDIYEYHDRNVKVEAPDGKMIDLDTKYCFDRFE